MTELASGRVGYVKAITDAWKSLKCGALWGIVGTGWLAIAGLAAVIFGSAWALGLMDVNPEDPDTFLVMMAVLYGGYAVVGIAGGLFYLGIHGGAAHVADEVLAGRKPTYREGMAFGFRRWPTVFGFEFLYVLTLWTVWFLVLLLFGLVFTGMAMVGGDTAGAFMALGVCCVYIVILVSVPLLTTFVVTLEAVGVRTALLTEAGAWRAYRQLWSRLRHNLKPLFLMGLMYVGLMWAYQMVSSIVTTPVMLLSMGDYFTGMSELMQAPAATDPDAALMSMYSSIGGMYALLGVLSLALMWPLMTFTYPLMGSFYRQLTGIDPLPEPAQYPTTYGPPAVSQAPVAPGQTPQRQVPSEHTVQQAAPAGRGPSGHLPPTPAAIPPPPPRPEPPGQSEPDTEVVDEDNEFFSS